MLLTIKNTSSPATDLGYLLQKNPNKYHEFSLPNGKAHVFYSMANENECVANLLIEIDPIGLVRKKKKSSYQNFALEQYVNDRPYIASSFLSMAIAKVFRSAFRGVCKEKPNLVETPISLETTIAALPCKGENGKELLKMLFQPLGYELEIQDYLLNEDHPEWGKAKHYTLKIRKTTLLKELLSHIYVLIPELIKERINAGLANARAKGKHMGRPRTLTDEQIKVARYMKEKGTGVMSIARVLGCSRYAIYRVL